MLPVKIFELIKTLKEKTEAAEIVWDYDDENYSDTGVSSSLSQPFLDIAINYRFDTIEEVGTFRIDITEKSSSQNLVFQTIQYADDFNIVRSLYDSAQASGFSFNFWALIKLMSFRVTNTIVPQRLSIVLNRFLYQIKMGFLVCDEGGRKTQ